MAMEMTMARNILRWSVIAQTLHQEVLNVQVFHWEQDHDRLLPKGDIGPAV